MAAPEKRIALVTGGNRGIGFEICRQLAQAGLCVILTSRDPAKGQQAATSIKAEGADIAFHQLDVADPASIEAVRAYVVHTFGRLDVLVNNAAILIDDGISVFDISASMLEATFRTNTTGPFMLCQAFIPLMRQHNYGRVVNVSSEMGSLTDIGGGSAAYRLSKSALNALTGVLAAELRRTNIKVNSMCPGWVHTAMGGPEAPRTPAQGADTAVWLATLPHNGPSGGFFQDRKRIDW